MDLGAWLILAGLVAATCVAVAFAPALHRAHRRRQESGGGSAIAGLSSGLDAVWRPSAEEAHADWETQLEVPAPAPAPSDKGGIDAGTIVIDLPPAAL